MTTKLNASIDLRPPSLVKRLVSPDWVPPVVLAASAFLLLTMGGAVITAPISIPLLGAIAIFRSGWTRHAAIVVAALTIAEVTWAATYVLVEESKPWIWLLPLASAIATIATLSPRNFPGHSRSDP